MFAITMYRNNVQRAVCLFFAACIVSSSLAAGAIGAQSLEREAYEAFSQRG